MSAVLEVRDLTKSLHNRQGLMAEVLRPRGKRAKE